MELARAAAALNVPLPRSLLTYNAFSAASRRELVRDLGDPEQRFEKLLSLVRNGEMSAAIEKMGGLDFSGDMDQRNDAAQKFFCYVHTIMPVCGEGEIDALDTARNSLLKSWHEELSELGFEGLVDLVQFELRQSSAIYTKTQFRPFFPVDRCFPADVLFSVDDFHEQCQCVIQNPQLQNPTFHVHFGSPQRGGVKLYANKIDLRDGEMICAFTPLDERYGAGHSIMPLVFKIRADSVRELIPILRKFDCTVTTTVETPTDLKDLSLAGIHGRFYAEQLEQKVLTLTGQPIVFHDGPPPPRPLADLAESELVTFHRILESRADRLLRIVSQLAALAEVHCLGCREKNLNFPFLFIRAQGSVLVDERSRTVFYCPSDGYSMWLVRDALGKASRGELPIELEHSVTFHDSAE